VDEGSKVAFRELVSGRPRYVSGPESVPHNRPYSSRTLDVTWWSVPKFRSDVKYEREQIENDDQDDGKVHASR
jgi:hypothetical protein